MSPFPSKYPQPSFHFLRQSIIYFFMGITIADILCQWSGAVRIISIIIDSTFIHKDSHRNPQGFLFKEFAYSSSIYT